MLFETVDPVNDPHIVKYDKLHIYPLAIIANNRQGIWLNVVPDEKHKNNKTFQNWCNFEIDAHSWLDTIDVRDDSLESRRYALDALTKLIEDDRSTYPHKEGLVLYGQNMMLKVKTSFYHKAFELWSQLDATKEAELSKMFGNLALRTGQGSALIWATRTIRRTWH